MVDITELRMKRVVHTVPGMDREVVRSFSGGPPFALRTVFRDRPVTNDT